MTTEFIFLLFLFSTDHSSTMCRIVSARTSASLSQVDLIVHSSLLENEEAIQASIHANDPRERRRLSRIPEEIEICESLSYCVRIQGGSRWVSECCSPPAQPPIRNNSRKTKPRFPVGGSGRWEEKILGRGRTESESNKSIGSRTWQLQSLPPRCPRRREEKLS